MIVCGVDPGASGAVAFFHTEQGHITVIDIPVGQVLRNGKARTEISPSLLARIMQAWTPAKVFVERVGAMPGQGVSSTYQFGRGVGMVEGIVAALGYPITYVAPARWQKDLNCRGGKDGNRLRACELFPAFDHNFKLKKHDGRADAALIAYWGATR